MSGFIALHLGAGYHAESKRKSYKFLCNKACNAAVELLKQKSSAVSAVSCAVSYLEDSPLTNAGIGSNLTIDGTVECDASIMDGSGLNFGSVGAIYNIKNPIKVAQEILEAQGNGMMSCGRIPPCSLVGEGAVQWAQEHGFDLVDSNALITEASQKNYSKCMSLLNSKQSKSIFKKRKIVSSNHNKQLLDTVGALCIDMDGNVASAVSSGGLMLKHSGRLGQAAIFGAGCWAQNRCTLNEKAIAVNVSGSGEYLIKTLLAKECYECLSHNNDSLMSLPDIFQRKFIESPLLQNVSSKFAGILSLTHHHDENITELSWVHNTKTFLIGYMSTLDKKSHTFVSEQTKDISSGNSILASGRKIDHRC